MGNNPLTLDDLKNMNGCPVFVICEEESIIPIKAWGIVDCEYECVRGLNYLLAFEEYDICWVAYSNKI